MCLKQHLHKFTTLNSEMTIHQVPNNLSPVIYFKNTIFFLIVVLATHMNDHHQQPKPILKQKNFYREIHMEFLKTTHH